MIDGILLALAAGIVAAVNPCGFALLPAYLSLLVLEEEGGTRTRAVVRALTSSAALTVGFVTVFAAFGLVISPVAAGVQRYLPAVTVALGVMVVLAGAWLLVGRSLPVIGWSPRGPRPTRRFVTMVGFGAAYAVASLTCTIAPFLAIVVVSFRGGSIAQGLGLFVAYGVGMGLLVTTVALAVALARTAVVDRLRRTGSAVPRVSGLLLVLVGVYVAYYGWWELRVLDGGDADDRVIEVAARAQGWIAAAVGSAGIGWWVSVVVVLIIAGLVSERARRRARRQAPPLPH
ncbi:MAG TPA: cytochrome c biogenesis protein CcdA [Microlunatus sp.]